VAITVDWGAKVISVPQVYLSFIGGTLYELDVEQFFRDLRDIEDSEEGVVYPAIIRHATEVTLGGVTYARAVEIINGYTVTFENGSYRVRLAGANNNIGDVTNLNYVSVLAQNSAGLQVVVQGSGVTQQDKDDIVAGVYAHQDAGIVKGMDADVIDDLALDTTAGQELADGLLDRTNGAETGMTLRQWLRLGAALMFGKTSGFGTTTPRFRDTGDGKDRIMVTHDGNGNRVYVSLDGS
jgi:hypothetical protein